MKSLYKPIILSIILISPYIVVWPQTRPSSTQTPAEGGSITGTVLEADSGIPTPGIRVAVDTLRNRTTTDAYGRYEITNVPSGPHRLKFFVNDQPTPVDVRYVTIVAGNSVTGVDVRYHATGEISGAVLDQAGIPVGGLAVFLISNEYLGYTFRAEVLTDESGHYLFRSIEPGRPYLLLAKTIKQATERLSQMSATKRLPIMVPTLYPMSPDVASAQPILIHGGERLEGINVTMLESSWYCVSGTILDEGFPRRMNFEIVSSPVFRAGNISPESPQMASQSDGSFHICGLNPGEYQINTSEDAGDKGPMSFGFTRFTLSDQDIESLLVIARHGAPLSGDLVIDDGGASGSSLSLDLTLRPLNRTPMSWERASVASLAGPGTFVFDNVLVDEYVLSVTSFTPDFYVGDVQYGSVSILAGRLRFDRVTGDDRGLHIVLRRDGGKVTAHIKDKEGNPVPYSSVLLIPSDLQSSADIGSKLVRGQSDYEGKYVSPSLRPGRYYVVASRQSFELVTPELIDKLSWARFQGTLLEVTSHAIIDVTLGLAPM